MKPLNTLEIEQIVIELSHKIGAQVQSVLSYEAGLIIELRRAQSNTHILVDLTPQSPLLVLFNENLPMKPSKKAKPVALFLKSHLVGSQLTAVSLNPDLGRVVYLQFTSQSETIGVEVRLFPHGQNLLVNGQKKSISWNKPKELDSAKSFTKPDSGRSIEVIRYEWLSRLKSKKVKEFDWQKKLEQQKKKIGQLLAKIDAEIAEVQIEKQESNDFAHWLVEHQSIKVPSQWERLLCKDKSLSYNINEAFNRVKKFERKLPEIVKRREMVSDKLKNLSVGDIVKSSQIRKVSEKIAATNRQSSKRIFISESQYAEVGKSAKDNLEILRQARPWDLWLHLKDFPGSYGILHRNKNEIVQDSDLNKIATWVAKMSLRSKFDSMIGDTIEVLVCECRYLKVIKGDKLGRVTYKNARSLALKIKKISSES